MSTIALTTSQQRLIDAIRFFIKTYGQAFPSVTKLAQIVKLSSRQVTKLTNQLVELGLLKKIERYGEINGQRRRLSNMYEIIEPKVESLKEEKKEPEKQPSSPYKRTYIKDFNNKKDDDDYIHTTHYKQREFFNIAKEHGISEGLTKLIYKKVHELVKTSSLIAIDNCFYKVRKLYRTIGSIPHWFVATLTQENGTINMPPLKKGKAAARI